MVGRTGAPNRDARTRCGHAPCEPGTRSRRSRYPASMPMATRRIVILFAIALAIPVALAACSPQAGPSFEPSGACTADGSAPGAYPDLEVRVPAAYRDAPPATLDSGRNCSGPSLGTLAQLGFNEVRFAGGTWAFGAERAVVLAVFSAPGLDAGEMADFYAESARAASRTEILANTTLSIAGRPARRLDTKTGERLQTVVTWSAADPDVVNVVITNDLPEARIADAIAAFGAR